MKKLIPLCLLFYCTSSLYAMEKYAKQKNIPLQPVTESMQTWRIITQLVEQEKSIELQRLFNKKMAEEWPTGISFFNLQSGIHLYFKEEERLKKIALLNLWVTYYKTLAIDYSQKTRDYEQELTSLLGKPEQQGKF